MGGEGAAGGDGGHRRGRLKPIVHSRWPLAEAGAALSFMRSARHLGKIVVTTPPLTDGRLRGDRTYLVTGGLGGIGCAVAGWLADRGAGAIVLNGRREPDADAAEKIRALRERGVEVQVELADMTDADAIDAMLARVDRALPPLAGVIHSVGVLSDGALTNQTWERFERVLWPKVLGAWHLHRATLDRDLDMFCLFTSRVGVMGNPGQANHASANAFLDQLAGHRRALGLAGQAIAWGAWSEIGEAAEQRERIDERRSALGGRWFTPEQGIQAFDGLARLDATTSVVMAMDWAVFAEAVAERPPLLEELLASAAEAEAEVEASPKDVLTRLRDAPAGERESVLVSFLQGEVQAVLRLPSAPSPTVGFFDLGMDSLMAVELRNRLNRALAGTYTAPNTLVFDYPDIETLAAHLADELVDADAAPPAEPEQHAPAADQAPGALRAPSTSPAASESTAVPASQGLQALRAPSADQSVGDPYAIAIVGMACRFPGAPDLAAFWRLLETGADMVTDGRRDAGSWQGVAGDPEGVDHVVRRGAFLEDIDKFDARFFGIPPIEARTMDPRQRLLLETTWHALEDAGIDPTGLRGSRTGVYAGVGNGDYRDLAVAQGEAHGYLGTTMSVTAGRVSFALGLTGPAIPLDMACASSLAAVHQAAAGLRQGDVDMALVSGVNAVLSPDITSFMHEVGMLSKTGRCSTFDEAADGFVRGEGCGVVILKRLGDAVAEGDRIWGVIRGSAVNQNGQSAALTVPNGPAQERVIEDALAVAGIPPGEVDYLEAHGAGSDLGDPIEVQAAAAVYGRDRAPERPLLIGSVKTNLGHLECAAGVASLIKAVLAANEGWIPKQLHFHRPSAHLDWDRLPVRVTSERTDWPAHAGRPPRAGVSSFGISGTNAHVVIEGHDESDGTDPGPAPGGPAGSARRVSVALPARERGLRAPGEGYASREQRVLPVSAKSRPALRRLARRYLEWVDGRTGGNGEPLATDAQLADMAWTAGVGRGHFAHRAAVVFRDAESLRAGLDAVAGAEPTTRDGAEEDPGAAAKVAFVYAGEGSAHVGMGRRLHEREPVVRAVLNRCDEILAPERAGASLLDFMFDGKGAAGRLGDPEWAHPATFALACALTALWESVGIRPAAVAGEGVGALAAAWAGGAFSLEDGLRLAAARGTVMARPRTRVAAAMPSGDPSATERDALAELEAAFDAIDVAPAGIALLGHATGQRIDPRRAIEPGQSAEARPGGRPPRRLGTALADLGIELVIEIGPQQTPRPTALAVWRKGQGAGQEPHTFAESVAAAYEAGLPVSFAGLFAGERRRRIALPGYPFERQRHWIDTGS